MTKWCSDRRQRKSARYKALHHALRLELLQAIPDKAERKRASAARFRACGEIGA